MLSDRNRTPYLLIGVLAALLLIAIGTRLGGAQLGNPRLSQRFVPTPADPNAPTVEPFRLPQVSLPGLPPQVAEQVAALQRTLAGGGAAPALTPVAEGRRVRIEIADLRRSGDELKIAGKVTNTSAAPLTVATDAFSFRDSAGTTYRVAGGRSATLQPGQSTTLDLSVPLPAGRSVTLVLDLPPDPPLEQVLVLATSS
jgi:hypothetical protein